MKPPILITGAARSGTSMTAGIIHICGAWKGVTSGPTRFNRKGMFENGSIRGHILKPFLRAIGADPMGQKPLPKIQKVFDIIKEKENLVSDFRNEVFRRIQEEGCPEDRTWMYKGAKMCLVWPIWHAAFPEAKWVIVRRDAEDIVRSCLRTTFMRAYDTRSGWLGWVAEHEKRFEEMVEAGLDIREVWPQRMIAGDFTGMQMVINDLYLKWQFKKVREFVDPKLWRKWDSRREGDGK